jgi:hypothetical protein
MWPMFQRAIQFVVGDWMKARRVHTWNEEYGIHTLKTNLS